MYVQLTTGSAVAAGERGLLLWICRDGEWVRRGECVAAIESRWGRSEVIVPVFGILRVGMEEGVHVFSDGAILGRVDVPTLVQDPIGY